MKAPLRNNSARLLLGPGPSPVHPRVLAALSEPVLGHLDPEFCDIMSETTQLLRYVFATENALTVPLSGTGSAGMDASLTNLLEPGDKAVVLSCGVFGERLCDIVPRLGAELVKVDSKWGTPVDPADVKRAIAQAGRPKVVAAVHAETSTGVLQPLEEITKYAHEAGALMVVDAVTSLGGTEVPTDRLSLDFVYSGTQKCLSCPPGLAPVTLSEAAQQAIARRKSAVSSWYLDLSMIQRYWTGERFYHHTAPVNMVYALHEALSLIREETLEHCWARHARNARAFSEGVTAMGLELLVAPEYRLPSLVVIKVPQGIDDAQVRQKLLSDYNIEIGGGLGELKGKIWRVGLMGHGSKQSNIVLLLAALEHILKNLGMDVPEGAGTSAASRAFSN
jgi:alanine-glyoxylate transaminase/serine-glyoxylate transaminase/serine-pyruvate transaminase